MILRDLRSAILLKLAPAMKNKSKIRIAEKNSSSWSVAKTRSKPGELERALENNAGIL